MKKLLSILLALTLVLALGVTAFAGSATITITGSAEGQTYSAWKIFDVKTTSDGKGYAYSIAASETDILGVIATESGGVYTSKIPGLTLTLSADKTQYVVTLTNDGTAALQSALLQGKDDLGTADGTETADETKTATITGLEPGYYFVDSSLGSLCILDTTDIKIAEKNGVPDSDKKIVEGTTESDEASYSVGDTVNFKITVTAGGKADTSYVVHDVMSNGLTLGSTFTVTLDPIADGIANSTVATSNYTIETNKENIKDSCTFEVTFLQSYTETLSKGDKLIIEYTATVNSDAVTATDPVTNKAHVKFGDSNSTEDVTTVKTYDIQIVKTDGSNAALSGAKFKLYRETGTTGGYSTDDERVYVVAGTAADVKEGNYIVTATENEEEIVAGNPIIYGLEAGTYYLVETQAPDGYNKLTGATGITITGADILGTYVEGVYTAGTGVQVINETGSELPSTGGIGTTIFTVVGIVLMAGAAILLITKKRMEGKETD